MKYLIKCSKRFEDKLAYITNSFTFCVLAMLLSYSIDGLVMKSIGIQLNLQLVRVPWQCCCCGISRFSHALRILPILPILRIAIQL